MEEQIFDFVGHIQIDDDEKDRLKLEHDLMTEQRLENTENFYPQQQRGNLIDITPALKELNIIEENENQPTIKTNIISPESAVDSANVKIFSPTRANLAVLQTIHGNSGMHQSFNSTSTNNTDICILEPYESHYGDKFDEEVEYSQRLGHCDFTVLLHKQHDQSNSGFDESTEVIMINSLEYTKQNCNTFSGTDSDVEVLMSEEIIDSDWSAALDNDIERNEIVVDAISPTDINSTSASIKRPESTDQDISSAEESSGSNVKLCSYENMNEAQLLKVVKDQAAHIRQLEATLQRYRNAQQSLFEHVDALRMEFATADTDTIKHSSVGNVNLI